jgi:hypothetical protein
MWWKLVPDQENSDLNERENLRHAFLRVGLELSDDTLKKLVPQAQALRSSSVRIAVLDLSSIEPGSVFDARWKR